MPLFGQNPFDQDVGEFSCCFYRSVVILTSQQGRYNSALFTVISSRSLFSLLFISSITLIHLIYQDIIGKDLKNLILKIFEIPGTCQMNISVIQFNYYLSIRFLSSLIFLIYPLIFIYDSIG